MPSHLSSAEHKQIQELFGKPIEQLQLAEFETLLKELRKKYHPDRFEKYEDELVKEMAKEKFQQIELLAGKMKEHFSGGGNQKVSGGDDILDPAARFAFDDMKIEIRTRNKDLKYLLFGTYLRWLERGDKYKIPGTEASIIIDNDHSGVSVGFMETVRMYLTFRENDPLDQITEWLYTRIQGQADSLIIEGKRIPVDLNQMLLHIKRTSFLRIE